MENPTEKLAPAEDRSSAGAVAPGSAIRLDEHRVLEAVTGVNRRSRKLAASIYDMIAAVGYRLTPQIEMELSNRIANHVIGVEWPELAKFYAASFQNIAVSHARERKKET
jgi:hypothetical protein